MADLIVTSAFATATLSSTLDLELLCRNLPGSELSKSNILKYRIPEGNQFVAFYKSGKYSIRGKGVLENLKQIFQEILLRIKEAGFDLEIINLTVNNIVFKTKIELNTSLETIYTNFESSQVEYEPEQFPGMICKLYGVTFLLFSTGSIVVTGAKTVEEAEDATERFLVRLTSIS